MEGSLGNNLLWFPLVTKESVKRGVDVSCSIVNAFLAETEEGSSFSE